MRTLTNLRFLCRCTVLLAIVLFSGACVTETSGGLPGPAPTKTRVQAQLDLARGYLEQGNFDRARAPLEKALEIDPRHVEAHVLSALLFQAQNEFELADRHYRTALRIEPKNAQALNNYGAFLYSRGRFEEAVVTLSELIKDTGYRARAQAFENLGLAYLRTGHATAAQDAFLRSLELNFRQPRATLELADLAYLRGDYTRAATRLLEYKTMARQNARSLCLALKVARAQGDENQVASNSLALKNLFPEAAGRCLANN